MTVQARDDADYQLQVSGVGYAPKGGFSRDGKEIPVTDYADMRELCRAGLLCNECDAASTC